MPANGARDAAADVSHNVSGGPKGGLGLGLAYVAAHVPPISCQTLTQTPTRPRPLLYSAVLLPALPLATPFSCALLSAGFCFCNMRA